MASGTQFRWERELSESFQESARPSLWSRRRGGAWTFARESVCSEGRADLVWGRFDESRSIRELRRYAGLFQNLTSSRILAVLLREMELPAEDLLKRVGVSRPVLQKRLRALVEAGLIEQDADNRYSLISSRKMPKVEICSFELKLKNLAACPLPGDSISELLQPSVCRHAALFSRTCLQTQTTLRKGRNVGLVSHDISANLGYLYVRKRADPTQPTEPSWRSGCLARPRSERDDITQFSYALGPLVKMI